MLTAPARDHGTDFESALLPARAPLPSQAIAQPLPEQAGLAAACCSSLDISSVSNFHDVDDSVLMVYGIDHSIVALPQAING